MRIIIGLLFLLFFLSCNDNCRWEYDAHTDTWAYECDPPPYQSYQPKPLISDDYTITNLIETYPTPMLSAYFSSMSNQLTEISIERINNYSVQVDGIPFLAPFNSNYDNQIYFDRQTSYLIPSNVFIGICSTLKCKGNINLNSEGKAYLGSITYYCELNDVVRYTFNLTN